MARGHEEKNPTRSAETNRQETHKQEPNKQDAGKQEPNREEQGKQSSLAVRPNETNLSPNRRASDASRGWSSLARFGGESDAFFDRLFDQFTREWLGIPSQKLTGSWGLAMKEEDNHIIIRAEAPGFESKDFNIELRGSQLILQASHSSEEEGKGDEPHTWSRQEFFRAIPLPQGIDRDKVKAAYRSGVLTVTLQKSEESKGKRIAVE